LKWCSAFKIQKCGKHTTWRKFGKKCKGYHLALGKIQNPEEKKDLALSTSPPPSRKMAESDL